MRADTTKRVVRRWVEDVLNRGDLRAADDLLHEEVVFHHAAVPGPVRGQRAVKELVASLRGAFPDLHSPLLDVTAEDDRVAVRFSWRGTHRGELDGISPTGRPVSVQGSALYRVAGTRIVEAWADFDTVSLLRQIGALPIPSSRSLHYPGGSARA